LTFFDKMEPPWPLMVAKLYSKKHLSTDPELDLDPEAYPDPLVRGADLGIRIRIRIKM
jgi:hypothetical protein